MINILLAEDQAMVRGALTALLNMENDINVRGNVENGQHAIEALASMSDIDILLTDIEMPHVSGIELADYCQTHFPAIKIVIVTTFGRAGYVQRALEAGVSAFLLKDAPSEQLAQTLRDVMVGKRVIDPQLAMAALSDKDPLSDKERKALRLAGQGKTTSEISALLFLTEGTIRNYLSEAIAKLHATNRIDAARIAQQKGWL